MIYIKNALMIVIPVLFILMLWWFQPAKSLYDRIESALRLANPHYQQLLHVHVDRQWSIAFFKTERGELGAGLLEERYGRFKVADLLGRHPIHTGKALDWYGIEHSERNIHLLFGIVQDPNVSQIILISERNKAARIISEGNLTIWYSLMEDGLNLPVTIRATNRNGDVIYETGDAEYWGQ
ncbi:hypothetical protein [Paenibacillus thermotolerans]|uniref:hypothetical protein n=1 Tax=Paenibacillus thermotolerans TaxID=3027807 RepID=UPI002367F9DC|nr:MULTISPECIES: hypothetical protein [unclassified Paenibacillus]